MDRSKQNKNTQLTAHNILYRIVGTLLILTMLSLWLVGNMLAKYVVVDNAADSANVAAGGSMLLLEHEAYLDNGIYKLYDGTDENDESLLTYNEYDKVIPGVDIAKDPFVRLNLENSEVDYELYLKVIKSDPFPDTVTFELTDDWEYDETKDIYKYKDTFDAGASDIDDIPILKDNKLYVSEHYVGTNEAGNLQGFGLSFEATLKQAD